MGDSMQGNLNIKDAETERKRGGFIFPSVSPIFIFHISSLADELWNMGPSSDKDSSPGRGRVAILPKYKRRERLVISRKFPSPE